MCEKGRESKNEYEGESKRENPIFRLSCHLSVSEKESKRKGGKEGRRCYVWKGVHTS